MYQNLQFTFLLLCLSMGVSAQTEANFFFDLKGEPGRMVAPAEVQFINASSGINLDYNWTIDGESFSIEEECSQVFRKSGKYDVCLELKGEGGTDVQCQQLEFFDRDTRQEVISVSKN